MRIVQSPAERWALLWCLSFGVQALVLSAFSFEGRLPRWLSGVDDPKVLPVVAAILVLDPALALAGRRGPRAVALATRGVLLLILMVAVGFMLLFIFVWLGHGGPTAMDWGWGTLLQGLLPLGIISIAQWLSVTAVAENHRIRG
jgi:hypothetical protein